MDAKRGDRVALSAVEFVQTGQLDEAAAGPGILEQLVQQTGAIFKAFSILAATALLIWFGLRPATKALLEQPRPAVASSTTGPLVVEGPTPGSVAAKPKVAHEEVPNLIADLTIKMGRMPQKRLEQMIDYDEEQATAILRQWMNGAEFGMSAIPLARLLVEFGNEADAGRGLTNALVRSVGKASPSVAEDMAARIVEAVARGHEAGRAVAEEEFQARLEAQREEFEQRLASERQAWIEQAGEALVEQMLAAMRDMEARISESTARILRPLLTAQLRRQAVTELSALVRTIVSRDRGATLAVSGPDDLIAVLREKLADTTAEVTFSVSETPDVQVTLDHTVLQTRLQEWIDRIEEAVA